MQTQSLVHFSSIDSWPKMVHEKFSGARLSVQTGIEIYDQLIELHKIYQSDKRCEEIEIAVSMLLSYMNRFPLILRLEIMSKTKHLN